jgi:hypothetical protein
MNTTIKKISPETNEDKSIRNFLWRCLERIIERDKQTKRYDAEPDECGIEALKRTPVRTSILYVREPDERKNIARLMQCVICNNMIFCQLICNE